MAPDSLRAAAESALCDATGARSVVRLCLRCGSSSHGQPRLLGSDLAVSMSYARSHGRTPNSATLAVVAWGSGPIGVDVEQIGVQPCSELEEWTRAEALAKATGLGLVAPARPDLTIARLDMPEGYVAHAAGAVAGWRLVHAV